VLSFHARHRFSAELAATVGKTGTHQAKVITQGAEAGFYCEQHDASTPEGILNCTLDTENLCVLSVGLTSAVLQSTEIISVSPLYRHDQGPIIFAPSPLENRLTYSSVLSPLLHATADFLWA